MSTDRPQIEFICPLCHAKIERVDPAETPGPAGLQERIEQIMRLDEEAILFHFHISHTMQDVVMALGQARNALAEILAMIETAEARPDAYLLAKGASDVARRGLGEQ